MNKMLMRDIRLLVLNGESSRVRSALLTQCQIDLVLFINLRGETTAADISRIKKVSIQNASSKLSILHKKGYLERETRSAESGGIEHYYDVDKQFI